jgi:hypothetical protein
MTKHPGAAAHFMLRVTRLGPLVPARIRLLDHAPEDPPWNRLDRGRLSLVICADVAGEPIDPERMLDRLTSDWQPANSPGHWKYASIISKSEYEYQVARSKWAAQHQPGDPSLRPRQKIEPAQLPLPSFERENA